MGVFTVLLALIVISIYLFAALAQLLCMIDKLKVRRTIILIAGFIGLLLHAYLLHQWIDLDVGQNLSFFNMFCFMMWLAALIMLVATLRMPIENLMVFIFPMAALSIILVLFFPGYHIVNTEANIKQLIHILLSVLALSLLCIAAVQALVLAIQDKKLRNNPANMLKFLPSIESMETLLFQLIWLGFIVLSIVLITAILFFHHVFSANLYQKTVLSILAWGVYAILLWGRYFFGWRGRLAIRWTLAGFILLFLSYFGSRMLMELLL